MKHPLPSPTGVAGAYFNPETVAAGGLNLPWCDNCSRHAWPPRWRCRCGGTFTWRAAEGRGQVVSWSVVRRAVQPEMHDEVPYLVGFVALAPDLRIFTNFVGIAPEAMRVGLRVRSRADVIDVPGGDTLAIPVFEPDGASEA